MNQLLRASILFLALAGAPAAHAQDVVDPIGNLLDQVDEDTAEALGQTPTPDQLLIARLKRKKLVLRDEIVKIEARILPDIIA